MKPEFRPQFKMSAAGVKKVSKKVTTKKMVGGSGEITTETTMITTSSSQETTEYGNGADRLKLAFNFDSL